MSTTSADRVAVITGGGGGIGGACARRLAEEGFKLILVGRTEETLEQVASPLRSAGHDVRSFAADVRNWDSWQILAAELTDRHGHVDVLVNSAGGQFSADFADITPGGWAAVVDTNLTGTFLSCSAMLPLLLAAAGSVVNVVANIWQRAAPGNAHSGAARAGVVSLTRTMALELAPAQVRVNAVSPGLTDTAGRRRRHDGQLPNVDLVPVGRAASPEEIAEAVWFVTGPNARYMTGEVLVIDGGLQLA